jgi:hypothetical protein
VCGEVGPPFTRAQMREPGGEVRVADGRQGRSRSESMNGMPAGTPRDRPEAPWEIRDPRGSRWSSTGRPTQMPRGNSARDGTRL